MCSLKCLAAALMSVIPVHVRQLVNKHYINTVEPFLSTWRNALLRHAAMYINLNCIMLNEVNHTIKFIYYLILSIWNSIKIKITVRESRSMWIEGEDSKSEQGPVLWLNKLSLHLQCQNSMWMSLQEPAALHMIQLSGSTPVETTEDFPNT